MPATLLLFDRDLRTSDHAGLALAQSLAQPLICLYIKRDWAQSNSRYGLPAMGEHRNTFLDQALTDLAQQLARLGQKLFVYAGNVERIVNDIIGQYNVNVVVGTRCPGSYEDNEWLRLVEQHSQCRFHRCDGFTLFDSRDITPSELFPCSFSKFRKSVAKLPIRSPQLCPSTLPPPLRLDLPSVAPSKSSSAKTPIFIGGSQAGNKQLQDYFASGQALTYKATRNELDGWLNSSKFSPWLASGCLSVKAIVQSLRDYETTHQANESTEWIYQELLWREYFQWYAYHNKEALFRFRGISQRAPLTSFYPSRFKQWCQGTTAWPLVNACIKQLNDTGFISNRGRQIVASCLINELNIDWRYGAAYFEYQLVDYDVAINWGNWQYIAGTGPDPRGGRHFNLEKQTELYDPKQQFINKWRGNQHCLPTDTTDAADWPIA